MTVPLPAGKIGSGFSKQSKRKETKMSNIPAERQNTSPAIAALEALEIFADSVAGPDGQLVKFVRGNWTTGQDNETIDTDARFVAVLSGLRHGYIRWEDGQPVGRCMALVADHPIALARGELGDMDEQYWPRRDGEPVDPWSFCYELPLIDAESEGARLFSTSSVGGRQCIGKLARTYAQHTRKHAGELPIVTLASETYRHDRETNDENHRMDPRPGLVSASGTLGQPGRFIPRSR
jgi:hypothetical protein